MNFYFFKYGYEPIDSFPAAKTTEIFHAELSKFGLVQNLRRIGSQAMVVFKHKQDVKEWVESLNEKVGMLVCALKRKIYMWYPSNPSSPLEMRLSPDIHN